MASSTKLDLKSEIMLDHENIRELYSRYKSTPSSEHDLKMQIANTIIREIAVHGDAEELSFYNVLEKTGKGGIAAHAKEEHHVIKKLFYEADTTPAKSGDTDYDGVLAKAFAAFDEHAKEEEGSVIDSVTSGLSPEDNEKETIAFLKARKMAPPRPHPMAPQSGGLLQTAAGMQASFHDTVVNAIRGTQYVDLKYQHPDV